MNKRFGLIIILLLIMTMVSSGASARNNPIVEFFSKPSYGNEIKGIPFDKIEVNDYEDAINEGIKRQNIEIEAIINQTDAPTFENTIVALDRSGAVLNGAVLTLSNLEGALGDTVLMNILAKVTPAISEQSTSIMLNERLFDRIRQVYSQKDTYSNLSAEDMRLLEETYKSFVESGAALEGNAREKYRKLNAELSDLQVKYSQNVTNDMKNPNRWLWLKKEDLADVPESVLTMAREEAKEALLADGKQDDESLYLFTVAYPSYSMLMKYASNRDVRKRMYFLYNSRNAGGEFDNMQILKDIANVRLEIANLFGMDDYASYSLQHKMANNPATVYELLNNLREAYVPAMKVELAEIEAFAKESEGDDFKLEAWDYSYWSDKLKNNKYAFNDEDMRPYFELNNAIPGVFGLATKLYGYKFKENKNLPVYNPDVKVYEVRDSKGEMLGLLYADFFYRPGKGPGAWMTDFRPEARNDNGERQYPIVAIVCNFAKPNGKMPSLLTSYDMETFLHEFGHALHGLSADTKYSSLSGTNVYYDFVELFSQFNENYLTEKEYLDGFAKHYKTGKKMPAELVDKFIKSGQYGAAYSCVRQLNFGFLDMAYHTIKEPLRASSDVAEFERNAIADVALFEPLEGCYISPAFGHIFSGGYAAGYYGYKWSELLDADAFAAFKETGIFNKTTADKFRKMLRSGGTVDPMQLYIEFRGHKPDIKALLERDGIKAE
jgi:peptidyl-dipeptidase Dcp